MASPLEAEMLHIITAMTGTLGQDALDQAPKRFAQIVTTDGIAQTLMSILQRPQQFDLHVRLHASVLLKQLIIDNWNQEEAVVTEQEDEVLTNANMSPELYQQALYIHQLRSQQKELSEGDKNYLKSELPKLLSDNSLPLRSNISFSIATMGEYDFPAKWPNLLQGLLAAAQNPDPNIVQGGLLCFNVLLDKMMDTAFITISNELFHTLITILQNPATIPIVRIQALDLFSAFIKSYSLFEDHMSKSFEKKYDAHVRPTAKIMITLCLQMLNAPMSLQQPESCQYDTRGAAMKAITRLVTFFPVLTKSVIDVQNEVLDQIANALQQTVNIAIQTIIAPVQGHRFPEQITQGLTFFLNCIIAFLDIMKDLTTHFPKFIMNKLDSLLPALCHCLLLTQGDVETYQDDINQFSHDESTINYDSEESLMAVNDTERTAAVRSEANRFILIALTKWSKAGPLLVTKVASEMWQRGELMKQQFEASGGIGNNNAFWWKFQEAALMCIGRLVVSGKGYELPIAQTTFPIQNVIAMIQNLASIQQFQPGREDEVYLQSRSLWLSAHIIAFLSGNLSQQLHVTKQYELANQTQPLLNQCLNLLPTALQNAPLQTKITAAHAVSTCNQSFIAIDHCVLMYQCQQLNDQFYATQPTLKLDFDRCMATGEPIQLQDQFVNTIPIQFQSAFASHFPIYLQQFCFLLQHVEDQGMISLVECILWILQFFQQWHEQIVQLCDQYPYLQFLQPNNNSNSNPASPTPPTTTATTTPNSHSHQPQFLPHLIPHSHTLTAELIGNVISTLLQLWFKNSNNQELAELIVNIFHIVAALSNNHIESWAAQAYGVLLQFVKSAPVNKSQHNEDSSSTQLTDAGAKMATIGIISIILRCLSPGPFAESTNNNLDPSKQTAVSLITSLPQLLEVVGTTTCSFQPLKISTVIPVEEILNNFLPAIAQLALTCEDKALIYGCCAISSSILAMYSPYLVQMYSPQVQPPPPHPQLFAMFKSMVLLLVKIDPQPQSTDPTQQSPQQQSPQQQSPQQQSPQQQTIHDILQIDDLDAPIACRLLAQLLITYKSIIGGEMWKELLNLVILKLCTTKEYKLQHACVFIIARVGIHHCAELLQYLATECGTVMVKKLVKHGETIRSKKTGRLVKQSDKYEFVPQPVLYRAINVTLQAIETISSGYIKRIAMLFLCQCLNDQRCVQILFQLQNIEDQLQKVETQPKTLTNSDGTSTIFAEKSDKGAVTRSQATAVEQWSYCNAVTKMIKLICERGYQALLHSADANDVGDEDGLGLFQEGETDSEDESEDKHSDAVVQALTMSKQSKNEHFSLDEMFDMNSDDDDDDGGADDLGGDRVDYPESPYDRFYGVDLAQFLSSFVQSQRQLMATGQGAFFLAKEQLTATQQEQCGALMSPQQFFQQRKMQKKQEQLQRKQELERQRQELLQKKQMKQFTLKKQ